MEDSRSTVWVGSELGYLKRIEVGKNVVKNYGEAGEFGRSNAPSALLWEDSHERKILVGTSSGEIRLFSNNKLCYEKSSLDCGEGAIRGIGVYEDKIIACTEKGFFSSWSGDENKIHKTIGDDIRKMKQSRFQRNLIATGGKENNLKVFDLNKMEKPIFVAKNVKNDSLDLRQPVWVTDIDFLDSSDTKIVIGTGYHSIKIYDTRIQRRPTSNVEWEEYPITSISVAANGNEVIIGNTFGSMVSWDLRNNQKIGNFKGMAGSVSSIQCHATQDFLTCAGLDRFLRIYDLKTRGLLQKTYLKSKLSCILLSHQTYSGEIFGDIVPEENQAKKSVLTKDVCQTEASDSIWGQMEVTTDDVPKTTRKKKAKSITDENGKQKKKKTK